MAFKIGNNTVLTNNEDGTLENLSIDGVLVLDGDNLGNVTLQNVIFDTSSINLSSLTTDNILEGTSNLYYTDARVNSLVSPLFLAAETDRISIRQDFASADALTLATAQAYTDSAVSTGITNITTDDVPEGLTNYYFTNARINDYLSDNHYATITDVTIAESDANAYTDARESVITTSYQAYADQAEADAILTSNTYTDNSITAFETGTVSPLHQASLDYTDSREVQITNAYQAADSAAIAVANNYTDTQVTKTVIDGLNIKAASVQTNSVALGIDTTGNYIATISGTTNQVEVTGSGTETASVTVGLPANVTVSNNLTVEGNLTVNGTTTTVLSENTRINENLLYLNEGGESTITNAVGNGTQVTYTADNDYSVGYTVDITGVTPSSFNGVDVEVIAADSTSFTITSTNTDTYVSGGEAYGHAHVNVDLGWAGAYDDGTYAHAGFFRDATDGVFKVFDGYTVEPSASVDINTSHASFSLADFEANNVIINGTPTASNHATTKSYVDNAVSTGTGALDTDDIPEGTSNLYYTNARVDARIPTNVSAFTNDANYATTSQLFSGDYADLTNKPTNVSAFTNDAGYITSASVFSGDYEDLTNKPTIPTNNNELTNGAGYTTFNSNQATDTTSSVTFDRIVLNSTTDASATSTTHGLQVGTTAGQNIIVDTNEVMARNNGVVSGLHLNADGGDVTINNNLTEKVTFSGGFITATGDVTAYSDRALKRNIQTIENALEKVTEMRGVTFLKDGRASLGVIAQEVETVIPEVVRQDNYGMRSVAYGNIVGVLIEAIKEQQKQIENLQSEIANLKK